MSPILNYDIFFAFSGYLVMTSDIQTVSKKAKEKILKVIFKYVFIEDFPTKFKK